MPDVSYGYDNYLARLAEKNQLLTENFVQINPRGQYVMDKLSSSHYTVGHPVLDDIAYGNRIDDAQWRNFIKELEFARQVAGKKESDNATEYEWPRPGWRVLETPAGRVDAALSDSSTPTRRTEVVQQNMLWGEHKVSGGSGEIGQWLDYAVLGAGLQDEDDDDQVQYDASDSVIPEFKENNLPAYCDPPNPCPVGYDPDQLDSPCDRDFVYTVEANLDWIMQKLARGECTCDTEHMNSCPSPTEGGQFSISRGSDEQWLQPRILNPYTRGRRRSRLVAKKSGHYRKPLRHYYYLNGKVLKNVVKKNGVLNPQASY